MYRAQGETIEHLFTDCNVSVSVHRSGEATNVGPLRGLQEESNVDLMVDGKLSKERRELILLSIFLFWRERCSRIFNDKAKPIDQLVGEVLWQWRIPKSFGNSQTNVAA